MYKNLMSYITEDTIRFFSFLSPNEKVYQRKGVKFVEECGFPRYNKVMLKTDANDEKGAFYEIFTITLTKPGKRS